MTSVDIRTSNNFAEVLGYAISENPDASFELVLASGEVRIVKDRIAINGDNVAFSDTDGGYRIVRIAHVVEVNVVFQREITSTS